MLGCPHGWQTVARGHGPTSDGDEVLVCRAPVPRLSCIVISWLHRGEGMLTPPSSGVSPASPLGAGPADSRRFAPCRAPGHPQSRQRARGRWEAGGVKPTTTTADLGPDLRVQASLSGLEEAKLSERGGPGSFPGVAGAGEPPLRGPPEQTGSGQPTGPGEGRQGAGLGSRMGARPPGGCLTPGSSTSQVSFSCLMLINYIFIILYIDRNDMVVFFAKKMVTLDGRDK